MGLRHILILLFALVSGVASPFASASAQGTRVGVPVATCAAPVRPGDTPAAMLAAPGRFTCLEDQRVLGSGDFWVVARRLPGSSGIAPSTLRSGSLWQRRATIWASYADKRIALVADMDDHGITRALQPGAIVEVPIPVRGVRATALLWRIDGALNARGIVNAPRIATPAESVGANLQTGSLFAGFGGLCIALLVFNLALWVVLRQDFQLAYCLMVIFLGGYALSTSGALGWWADMANTDRIRLNYALLALGAIAATAFAQCFFERRLFRGWFGRAGIATSATLGAATIAFVLLAPWHGWWLDRIYTFAFFGLILYAAAVLVQAYRMRVNQLWLFALSWAAPIAFAGLRLASELHLIGINGFIDHSSLMAMTVEALLSSVAISYRLRLLLVERDTAIAGETAARALADRDPLTGLLNRRAFLREAIGTDEPKLLVLADIDHFKRVNDTIGHDGGDEVLRRIARAITEAAPGGSLIARVGGEEFAILAPRTYELLPDVVMAAVRATPMPFDLRVTTSVGCGSGAVTTEADWARLYRDADAALYDAKRAGRDRARHAPVADYALA